MKKTMSILIALSIVAGFGGKAAAAAGDSISYSNSAGITPDSVLYSIDKTIEDLSLKLAGTDEKKLEILTDIAEERLGESEVMSEKGKTDLAQDAMLNFNDSMDKCSAELDKITDSVQSSDDASKQAELDKLQEKVAATSGNSVQVLEKIKDKLPAKAKDKAAWIIEMQQAKKEAVKLMVEKRHEFNAARKTVNEAKTALEKVQKSGNEEEIAKAKEALESAQQTYSTKQQDFKQAFENKKLVEQQYKGKKNEASDKKDKKDETNGSAVVNESKKPAEKPEKSSLPKAEKKSAPPADASSSSTTATETSASLNTSTSKNKGSENKNIEQKKNLHDADNNESASKSNKQDDAQSKNKKDKN